MLIITFSTRLIAILTQLRKAVLAFVHRQTHAQNPVWLGTIAYAPAAKANQPPPLPAETWELLIPRPGEYDSGGFPDAGVI